MIGTFLDQNKGLKLAILAGFWEKWQIRIDGKNFTPAASRFAEVLAATVKRFRDRGVLVLIIGQTPGFPSLRIRCILRETSAGRNADVCGMPAQPFIAQAKPLSDFFASLAAADRGITYSAPETFMCGPAVCSPVMDGILLYRDTGHVNAVGAVHLGKYIKLPLLH